MFLNIVMIDLNKEKIRQICIKYGIRSLYLAGSSARYDHTDESDIDFLITFMKTGRALDQYFGVREELEEAAGRRVDLIEESAIKNEKFKNSIIRDKVLLYEA
jgi:predicted nucleotidyltransferase